MPAGFLAGTGRSTGKGPVVGMGHRRLRAWLLSADTHHHCAWHLLSTCQAHNLALGEAGHSFPGPRPLTQGYLHQADWKVLEE